MVARNALRAVPTPEQVTWEQGADAFLARDLSSGTRRVYRLTLEAVGTRIGPLTRLATVTQMDVVRAAMDAYPSVSPNTWNRVVATVRSFGAYAGRSGWTDVNFGGALERRRAPEDRSRALAHSEVERLLALRSAGVRDRALWRLLYETAARAEEVLSLNVEDLDLENRRAYTTRKGGDLDVLHFQTGSARLLPRVIDGRTRGPLFLSNRPPAPGREPATADRCPETGRARLSYRQAAQVFKTASGGRTLHQLRHSAITDLAEAGVPLPLLMAKSAHSSLRTLQRYARPSVEAVARLTADHDPAARRPHRS